MRLRAIFLATTPRRQPYRRSGRFRCHFAAQQSGGHLGLSRRVGRAADTCAMALMSFPDTAGATLRLPDCVRSWAGGTNEISGTTLTRLLRSAAVPPAIIAAFAGLPAIAQESAVRTARDAFGERVGIEQVGLYSESQVRGFDLQSSGAYRVDGSYFARQGPLGDSVLAGVGVLVGVNAARLEAPSPSGVVDYRLRDTAGNSQWYATVGRRGFGTNAFEVGGLWVSEDDRLGVAAATVLRPEVTSPMGSRGEIFDYGIVARWSPTPATTIRAFGNLIAREYDGDYGIRPVGADLPPNIKPLQNYSPAWADTIVKNAAGGLLLDTMVGAWAVNASALRSNFDSKRSDFTLLRVTAEGDATTTIIRTPQRTFESDGYEVRVSRTFENENTSHRLSASARRRVTTALNSPGVPFALDTVNITETPNYSAEPGWFDDGQRVLDEVEHSTISAGYGLAVGDNFELRAGVHRGQFKKIVTQVDGRRTSGDETTSLYNVSSLWGLSERSTIFASVVSGLEEVGSAPASATNRGAILPPIQTRQLELGVRHSLTGQLTLIAAAFEVVKPFVGFRPGGEFGVAGEVTHRGVEMSLAGQVFDGTAIVLGAVALDPVVSGELVETGVVGDKPPGVSDLTAVASIDHQIALAPGWSIDAQATYTSGSTVNGLNNLERPGRTIVDVGMRRRFSVNGANLLFRTQLANAFDERGWGASANEFLHPVAPRTLRASLTVRFG